MKNFSIFGIAAISLIAVACGTESAVQNESGSDEAAVRLGSCSDLLIRGTSSPLCDLSAGYEFVDNGRDQGQLIGKFELRNGRILKCTITSGVTVSKKWKQSAQHPRDIGVGYIAKNDRQGAKYFMIAPARRKHLPKNGQCSPQSDRVIEMLDETGRPVVERVVVHTVAQDSAMVVTKAALLEDGTFLAYTDTALLTSQGISPALIDIQLNICFETPRVHFGNSIAFGRTDQGKIWNFKKDGTRTIQEGKFDSIKEFIGVKQVCTNAN